MRALILATVVSCVVSGCYAQAQESVGPPPAVAVTSGTPETIEGSPSVVYEGRPVYLYQDHWYYRDGNRWDYYRDEPAQLREHRARLRTVPPRRVEPQRVEPREHEERRDREDRR